MKSISLGRYRAAVASRALAAVIGGYGLAAASAACLGHLLHHTGMGRPDAVATATMLAFIIHACAAIWVFACANAWRAWIGILLPAALFGCSAWLYGAAP